MNGHGTLPLASWPDWRRLASTQVSLGTKEDGGIVTLRDAHRRQHIYICGRSGTGKSCLVTSIVCQDILRGACVVYVDMIGTGVPFARMLLAHANLKAMAREKVRYRALRRRLRDARREFFGRVMIADLADPECPWRYSPFSRVEGLSTGEQSQEFCGAVQRMLGAELADMRQLALILHSTAAVAIETDLAAFRDLAELLLLGGRDLKELLRRLEKGPQGVSPDIWLAMLYLRRMVAEAKGREKRELVSSTLRAIALVLNSPMASRLLSSAKGNLDLSRVVDHGHSLLLAAPPIELHAQVSIVATLLGRLMALAMRRSSAAVSAGQLPIVYLVLDEAQSAYSDQLSKEFATLRNKGVSLAFCHQSGHQPPFNQPHARSALEAIRDNCSVRIYLRLGRKDAEDLAAETFQPKGLLVKVREERVSLSEGRSDSLTLGRSHARTSGATQGWGTTRSEGRSLSSGVSRSLTATAGTQSGHTEGEASSVAEGTSAGRSVTTGTSRTRTEGLSSSSSATRGSSFGFSRTSGSSEGLSHGASMHAGEGRVLGLQPGAESSGLMIARENLASSSGTGRSRTQSHSVSLSDSQSHGRSRSESEGWSESDSWSRADSSSSGESETRSTTRTGTRSASASRGESWSRSAGRSRTQTSGESETRGTTRTNTRSASESEGHSAALAEGRSRSITVSEETVRYSVLEETLIMGQVLQSLPNRTAVMTFPGEDGIERVRFRTADVPMEPVVRIGSLDGLADLDSLTAPDPAEPPPAITLLDRLRARGGAPWDGED